MPEPVAEQNQDPKPDVTVTVTEEDVSRSPSDVIVRLSGQVERFRETTDTLRTEVAQMRAAGRPASEVEEKVQRIGADVVQMRDEMRTLATELRAAEMLRQDRDEATDKSYKLNEEQDAFYKHLQGETTVKELAQLQAQRAQGGVRLSLVEDASNKPIIPERDLRALRRDLPEDRIFRRHCRAIPVAGDSAKRGMIPNATATFGSLETGEKVEADIIQNPDPKYGSIHVKELNVLILIGRNLVEDNTVQLRQALLAGARDGIGDIEDNKFCAGDGLLEPEGLFQQIAGLENWWIPRFSTLSPGAVTLDDMLRLIRALPKKVRKKGQCQILTSPELLTQFLLEKNSNGDYMVQHRVTLEAPEMLAGWAVHDIDGPSAVPSVGTSADVAGFGNLGRTYQIIDRHSIRVKVFDEKFYTQGLYGYMLTARYGGGIAYPNHYRILNVPA